MTLAVVRRAARAAVLAALLALAGVLLSAGAAHAQPCPSPLGPPICTPPPTTPEPEPSRPTATALPTASRTATEPPPQPSSTDTGFAPFTPEPFPPGGLAPGGPPPPGPEPSPTPALTPAPPPAVPPAVPVTTAVAASPVSLSGIFGLTLGTLLAVALLLVTLASVARPRLAPRPARAPTAIASGGFSMDATSRRWRLYAGMGSLGLAAIVGFIGYYKLSGEPLVNRQLPYLASAGMTLVVLVVLGGSLLVAEQMRNDASRIEELEESVATLAHTLAPLLESPARRREVVASTAQVRREVPADEASEAATVRLVESEQAASPAQEASPRKSATHKTTARKMTARKATARKATARKATARKAAKG